MDNFIKYKRKNGNLDKWAYKLYVPVMLKTNNQVANLARKYRMSKAELSAVIIMHYLDNPRLSLQAIRTYRTRKRELRRQFLQNRSNGIMTPQEFA